MKDSHGNDHTLLVLLATLRRLNAVVDRIHRIVVAAEAVVAVPVVPITSRSIDVGQTLNLL